MKKNKTRILKSIGLVALISTLSISMCGCNILGQFSHAAETDKTIQTVEKVYPNLMSSASYGNELDKEETIYVIADADGNKTEVIANEWLKNGKGVDLINDYSELENIDNITGNEKFTKTDEGIDWEADGNDIKYQGEFNGKLPVETVVSYYLDGEKMSAGEMVGKSGKIEIRFLYNVNRVDVVKVNSENISIIHPYTMASGLVLDNEYFSNVQVNNGKAVDDGENSICIGIAFPGLQNNLKIDSSSFEIPENVVITADTDNFQIDGTFTVAISGMLDEIASDNDLDSDITKLTESLTQLNEASDALLAGTNELSEATEMLNEGTGELVAGTAQLAEGTNELNSGLKTLEANSDALNEGTAKIESTIFETATKELRAELVAGGMSEANANAIELTPDNYLVVIATITGSKASEEQIATAETALRAELVKNKVTDIPTQTVIISLANDILKNKEAATTTEALTSAATIAKEAAFVGTQYTDGISNPELVFKVAVALCATNKDEAANYVNYIDTATKYCQDAAKYADAVTNASAEKVTAFATIAVYEKLASAAEGLSDLKASLDEIETYVAGVNAYTGGVSKAYEGSETLFAGISSLQDGINKIDDGTGQLNDGAGLLYENMYKFDEEGIDKMVSTLDEADIQGLSDRIHAVAKASSIDVLIGGKTDEMLGDSKIIFKTDSVGK